MVYPMLKCSCLLSATAALALGTAAYGQLPPKNVQLASHVSLATFGSSEGNDCWGYVSPSGREYGLVGLNNLMAVVEVTDPANPVIVEKIPHSSSSWGDIKTYGHYAYVVTETNGTGIQVIDLSQVDAGIVTLVKTITSPGRSHNLVMDATNGFLYTTGSNNGTGTTMCFSLADPANPVQVGPASMTTNYQHDAQIYTYTSGPLAGHQIWFGFSESRGVDIYDMTDKNNPVMIKRATYPNMGYCHQGWMSEDHKYLYVDDEFDENNLHVQTRSLVFNIEDPANAFYVGSYTTGLFSIDHNQYVTDGFTFQANYRSGLRIFDVTNTPESPTQVGSYDTYPADDNRGYNGAWSNYPFFPSGTVIVSDIDDGLFVFNVKDATTRAVNAQTLTMDYANLLSGSVNSLQTTDGQYAKIGAKAPVTRADMRISMTTTAYDTSPNSIAFEIESKTEWLSAEQHVSLFDWTTNSYHEIGSGAVTTTQGLVSFYTQGDSRYVNPTTKQVKVEIRYKVSNRMRGYPNVLIDYAKFKIER